MPKLSKDQEADLRSILDWIRSSINTRIHTTGQPMPWLLGAVTARDRLTEFIADNTQSGENE